MAKRKSTNYKKARLFCYSIAALAIGIVLVIVNESPITLAMAFCNAVLSSALGWEWLK